MAERIDLGDVVLNFVSENADRMERQIDEVARRANEAENELKGLGEAMVSLQTLEVATQAVQDLRSLAGELSQLQVLFDTTPIEVRVDAAGAVQTAEQELARFQQRVQAGGVAAELGGAVIGGVAGFFASGGNPAIAAGIAALGREIGGGVYDIFKNMFFGNMEEDLKRAAQNAKATFAAEQQRLREQEQFNQRRDALTGFRDATTADAGAAINAARRATALDEQGFARAQVRLQALGYDMTELAGIMEVLQAAAARSGIGIDAAAKAFEDLGDDRKLLQAAEAFGEDFTAYLSRELGESPQVIEAALEQGEITGEALARFLERFGRTARDEIDKRQAAELGQEFNPLSEQLGRDAFLNRFRDEVSNIEVRLPRAEFRDVSGFEGSARALFSRQPDELIRAAIDPIEKLAQSLEQAQLARAAGTITQEEFDRFAQLQASQQLPQRRGLLSVGSAEDAFALAQSTQRDPSIALQRDLVAKAVQRNAKLDALPDAIAAGILASLTPLIPEVVEAVVQ